MKFLGAIALIALIWTCGFITGYHIYKCDRPEIQVEINKIKDDLKKLDNQIDKDVIKKEAGAAQ